MLEFIIFNTIVSFEFKLLYRDSQNEYKTVDFLIKYQNQKHLLIIVKYPL